MLKFLTQLCDRLFAVAGALIFSQFPLFIYQYQHQLQGHYSELKKQIDAMNGLAQKSGKNLGELIKKFTSNTDADFSGQGEIMNSLVHRWEEFSIAITALKQATPLSRPFLLFKHFYSDVAESTYSLFVPGIPLTIEGACYALAGLTVGYALFSLLRKGIGLFGRSFRLAPTK